MANHKKMFKSCHVAYHLWSNKECGWVKEVCWKVQETRINSRREPVERRSYGNSKIGEWTAIILCEQENPAVADKPARRERMPKIVPIRRPYYVVADNTGLSSFVYLLLRPNSAKSREIHWKFKLIEYKVIQGHRSWCQSKAHVRLPISH